MNRSLFTQLLHRWQALLSIHRWLAYVLPLAVYMLVGSFESTQPESSAYRYYPWIYAVKLLATLVALRAVWPVYKSAWRPVGWQGVAVGAVGAVVWIGLCQLQLEQKFLAPLLAPLGLESFVGAPTRSAYNPMVHLADSPMLILVYLLVRGTGLILVVPIIEEYFLRGFLMRFVAADKWWKYPIGSVTVASALVGTLVPMLMHPSEIVAAAVWFSLVTLLYLRTGNLWECIAAHAVTNLLLGIYVMLFDAWQLV